MSITVNDCLQLPCLKDARVVAGHKGLSKIVNSVSVLESIENNILSNARIFSANEVILTAFSSIRNDVKAQCDTMEILFSSGDVALILYYVGYIVPDVDDRLIEKSDELGFPLILMPKNRIDAGYHEVISEIMEAVFIDKYHQTRFINHLLERISQLHEKQRTLSNIMQMLSDHLKCSILIYDPHGRSICFIKKTMSSWSSENILIDLFKDRESGEGIDFLELLDENNGDAVAYRLSFSKSPHKHLSLIILDENNSIEKEDVLSAVELIEVSSSIWKYKIDAPDLKALIPSILTDNISRMRQIAHSFSIDLESVNAMLITQLKENDYTLHQRYSINERIENAVRELLKNDSRPMLTTVYGELVIVAFKHCEDNDDFLDNLVDTIVKEQENTVMAFFNSIKHPDIMRQNYIDYCSYISNAQIIYPFKSLYTKKDFDFVKECTVAFNDSDFSEEILEPLVELSDAEDLIKTLEIFLLDSNSDTRKTGELMYIHRNTVLFRLKKIKKMLSYDLDKMPDAYLLYKAVALRRLIDYYDKTI